MGCGDVIVFTISTPCCGYKNQRRMFLGYLCSSKCSNKQAWQDLSCFITLTLHNVYPQHGGGNTEQWRHCHSLRHSLPRHGLLTLISDLTASEVDYCNSFLSGQSLGWFQSVLNAAARLVFSARKSERMHNPITHLHLCHLICQLKRTMKLSLKQGI